jgi:hypothetical protein
VYAYVLSFLASGPNAEQVMAFRPGIDMTERLETLLEKNLSNTLTELEKRELEEYERIEHLVIMLKARAFPYLLAKS